MKKISTNEKVTFRDGTKNNILFWITKGIKQSKMFYICPFVSSENRSLERTIF